MDVPLKIPEHVSSQPHGLLALPPELLEMIFYNLGFPNAGFPAMAALERASKTAQRITEPYLYHKVYTNNKFGKESMTTASIERLFRRRPHLVRMVHFLVIDEYDALALRQLLRIQFPNLESIIAQNEGPIRSDTVRNEQLDGSYVERAVQPKLKNLTLNLHTDSKSQVQLSKSFFLPLLDHPSLRRIRLSYIDLTHLKDVPLDRFQHINLDELNIELSPYVPAALERLIAPCKTLRTLILYDCFRLPFRATKPNMDAFSRVLSHVAPTLVVLKLGWRDVRLPRKRWPGFDFSSFTALRHLHLPPSFIFTPRRFPNSCSRATCARIFKKILPPRMKILGLDSIVPLYPHPRPPDGMGIAVSTSDGTLINNLLKSKNEVAPCLTRIFCYYNMWVAPPSFVLCEYAREAGVRLGFMEHTDDVCLPMDWLCKDGNDELSDESEDDDSEAELGSVGSQEQHSDVDQEPAAAFNLNSGGGLPDPLASATLIDGQLYIDGVRVPQSPPVEPPPPSPSPAKPFARVSPSWTLNDLPPPPPSPPEPDNPLIELPHPLLHGTLPCIPQDPWSLQPPSPSPSFSDNGSGPLPIIEDQSKHLPPPAPIHRETVMSDPRGRKIFPR